MTDICRDAEKRLRRLADDAVEEFEATICHNRVHEQVDGQHTSDDDLATLLDITDRAYDLASTRDGRDNRLEVFAAAEQLDGQVDGLVDERIAEACAVIMTEADGWTDAWDVDEIERAQREARSWVGAHMDAAERAGVLEDVLDAEVPGVER